MIPDDLVVHAGHLLHIAQSRVGIDCLLGGPAPSIEFSPHTLDAVLAALTAGRQAAPSQRA